MRQWKPDGAELQQAGRQGIKCSACNSKVSQGIAIEQKLAVLEVIEERADGSHGTECHDAVPVALVGFEQIFNSTLTHKEKRHLVRGAVYILPDEILRRSSSRLFWFPSLVSLARDGTWKKPPAGSIGGTDDRRDRIRAENRYRCT